MTKKGVAMILCRVIFVFVVFLSLRSESYSSATTPPSPTDCGWPSIDEITCYEYGCCWKTVNSSAIGCFNATNDTTTTMLPTTTVVPTTTTIVTTPPLTTTMLPTTTTTVPMTTAQTTSTPATTTKVTTAPETSSVVGTVTINKTVSADPLNDTATSEETTKTMTTETPAVYPSTAQMEPDGTGTGTGTDATSSQSIVTTVPVEMTSDIHVDTTAVVPVTTEVECVTLWTNHTDSFILGGSFYSQFSSSAAVCLDACANLLMGCVAANVFITNTSMLCLLHTNPSDLDNVFKTSDGSVGLYVLVHSCTTFTTVSPLTAPTEKPNCRAMAWLNSTDICCNGAMSYPEYKTVDECLNACSCLVSGCVAAFARNTTNGDGGIECFMNMASSNLGDLWSCPSVTQHVLLGSDYQVTTIQPTTQMPSTTVGVTTSGLVDYAICWHPPTIANAQAAVYKDAYGLAAIYTCHVGYIFAFGGRSRTNICKGNGWLIDIPGCIPVTCDISKYVSVPPYGGKPSSFDAGDVMPSFCPAGPTRFIDGSKVELVKCTVTNGRNGTLLKPLSGCKGGRCWSPPLVTNTTAVYDGATQTLYLTCIPGHRFQKGMTKHQFTCNADGTWPDISPCKVIFCLVLPPLTNGSYSTDNVIYGTVVIARCDEGYIFPDHNTSKVYTCTTGLIEDAEWDEPSDAQCQAVICTDPLQPVPGESKSDLATSGRTIFYYLESIQYDCLDGRKFSDGTKSQNVVCSANAFWSVDEVSCEYNRCDPVPTVAHATPNSHKATMGNQVTYTCDLGFWFSRNVTQKTTTCDGANWSPIDTQCVPVTCPLLNTMNADVNVTNYTFQGIADIRCDPGYLFNGEANATINCTADGQWSVYVTCRPIDCGQTDSVLNAVVQISGIETTFGNNATYWCIPGYWFSRVSVTMTAVCDDTGHWSINGVAGANHWRSCTPITCLPLITYVANTTNINLGAAVNVSCPVGYRFTSAKITDLESVCMHMGLWQPDIPGCISVAPPTAEKMNVYEASKSNVIAGVAISFVILGVIALLFFDWSRLMVAFGLFGKNVRGCCSSSSSPSQ